MGGCCDRYSLDNPASALSESLSGSESFRERRQSVQFGRNAVLDSSRCCVKWNHEDYANVGVTTVATVKFKNRNGQDYVLKAYDQFDCSVGHLETEEEIPFVQEPDNPLYGYKSLTITFTARLAGLYAVNLYINGNQVGDRRYSRTYCAAHPDPQQTKFSVHGNFLTVLCGMYECVSVYPRDCYKNATSIAPDLVWLDVRKNHAGGCIVRPDCLVEEDEENPGRYEILFRLNEPGYYVGCVKYGESVLGLQNLQIFCLSDESMKLMYDNIQCQFLTMPYHAKMVKKDSELRKVKCFLSHRQFLIREPTFFHLLSTRVYTCRVSKRTQFIMDREEGRFTIDDGIQPEVILISPHREVLVATFLTFVQDNLGGRERFSDKQRFFWDQLISVNPDAISQRPEIRVTVERYNLVDSFMRATKGFNSNMWKRKFFVLFSGESGIDVGGVSRELFTCVCDALFGGSVGDGLFTRFNKEDSQALVHPNPKSHRHPSLGLQYFEFAGRVVGKCIFESALGNSMLVKARFTRSFLAQIIGLRVTWKHFEMDDPELYQYKIKQIREKSIADLDLSLRFTEEDFDSSSNPIIVPLVSGGKQKRVTDNNKLEYLSHLAQYRLVGRVADEVKYFLKGLHDLIPDELLTIFDENELELLMCGVQKMDPIDMKENTEIRGADPRFLRVVDWFWKVVTQFSQEELARLVQFITGSSQIPIGGFAELKPHVLIVHAAGDTSGRLPYAHTCFNHLCLPSYNSFQKFHQALMTAINEGCEGILLD